MPTSDDYTQQNTTPAFALRWSWTGWPSLGSMPESTQQDWTALAKAWEQDGIRLLEYKCEQAQWQSTVSTRPALDPSFIVARIKGRID